MIAQRKQKEYQMADSASLADHEEGVRIEVRAKSRPFKVLLPLVL